MDGQAIIEVDALLKMVGAFRLTENEITKLEKAGHDPADLDGYYLATQQALSWRTSTNPQAAQQLDELAELAAMDAVDLPQPNIETPVVHVPIFGIGL